MSAPDEPTQGVVVLAPMVREAKPLAAALGLRPAAVGGGRAWHGPRGMVAVVGVGAGTAGPRARRLLGVVRPERVIIAGVCGALAGDLAVGDLVVPSQVVDAASGAVYRPDGMGPPIPGAHGGVLATVLRFGDAAPAEAVAVDLETAAIVVVCEELGVPWGVRRAVSDVPGAVSPAVAGLVKPGGGIKVAALIRLLVIHPSEIPTLLRLGRQLKLALSTLTSAIEEELGKKNAA